MEMNEIEDKLVGSQIIATTVGNLVYNAVQ